MTPNDTHDADPGRGRGGDRILDHHRLQLSALLDGELPPDEARFLLRRLQHDPQLLGCWERWQQAGDILRGQVELPLPTGFAVAVAEAVAREPKRRFVADGPRRLRWGGGAALAASAAVIALLLARQPQETAPAVAQSNPDIAAAPAPAPAGAPSVVTPSPDRVPAQAGELATALAVADVPRRLGARRSRAQSQRAAIRNPAQRAVPDTAVSAVEVDPFSGQHISLANRPWPRALLPASSAAGTFTVDYGTRQAVTPALYPFAPRGAPEPTDNASHP
jgi:anti-sigma factor RsiW